MTDATDTTIFEPAALRELRVRLRRERQARVGILRNPNAPPKPPARRAPLTGRWPNLRSSRRPAAPPPSGPDMPGSMPVAATVPPRDAVRTGDDGQVVAVDVAALTALADAHADVRTADSRTSRTPFAAEYRPDVAPRRRATDRPSRGGGRPSVLTAEAWLDDPAPPPDSSMPRRAPPRPRRPRRRGDSVLRLAGAVLGGMVLAVLSLLALLGPPP